MFIAKFFKAGPPTNQGLIDNVIFEMGSKYDPATPEYEKLLVILERHEKLEAPKRAKRLSADAALAVAGNLAGIVFILNHERLHVVTSKALGFVMKTRV